MPTFIETMQAVNWQHPVLVISAFVLGACVGSFLNVAIYRLPRGLSVNEPKRSFCPGCNKEIPWFRNIPLVTWLLQRGKCAECKGSIPFRYFAVELLTACLFLLMWMTFPQNPGEALFYMVLMALLVVVVFVDAELMLIPLQVTWLGAGLGLVAAVLVQHHLYLDGEAQGWKDGLWMSVKGLLAGFGGLWAVVILGKLAFGKKNLAFEEAVEWMLREPDENADENDPAQQLCFVIDGEAHGWGDLFYRDSDQLIIEGSGFRVDGKKVQAKSLVIKGDRVELEGKTLMIEELQSLEGKASQVTIPREAMGMGDVYLMGMLGCCLGWQSVIFTVFAACRLVFSSPFLGGSALANVYPLGLAWHLEPPAGFSGAGKRGDGTTA